MKANRIITFIAILVLFCGSTNKVDQPHAVSSDDGSVPAITGASADLPLNSIKLPAGFSIGVFAEVDNARSMAISPGGTIFVGNRNEDKVYAIKDTDGDHIADKKWVIASGLNMPNGVAFKDGDLYIAEVSKI